MKKISSPLFLTLLGSLAFGGCVVNNSDDTTSSGGTDTNVGTDSASTTASTSASTTASTTASTSASTTDPTGATDTVDPDSSGTDPSGATDTVDPTGGGDTQCQYRCSTDEDCFSNGVDSGLTCTDSGVCLNVCEGDAECVAQFSGWTAQPCTTNAECAAGPCVDLGDGAGGCGTAPSEFIDCATLMMEEITVDDIEGNPAQVCGNTSATCEPLGDDMTCLVDYVAPDCNVEDFCVAPLACGEDGNCHCASDDDCTAGSATTCSSDGFCIAACTDASDCTDAPFYDGGEYVCE